MDPHAATPYRPPKYVMLSGNNDQGGLRPPPYRRNIPRYDNKKSSSSRCLKCICCCYCCLIIITVLFFALTFFLYNLYKPQFPSYKVNSFDVHAFDIQSDMSLSTEFAVSVIADNPNQHIGLAYGDDSQINVYYSDSKLCSGKLPSFYQPRKNITMMNIVLKGNSPFGSGLQEALMENRHTGRIPLLVRVKVPVNVVLGQFPLRGVTVYVNCSLVINNLSPNKKVEILSAKYTYVVNFNAY
uniref:Late embryogenesis abundant protein LEA-2 subgroup domain-containing protein n=1 Tax=Fagus sylvatica TaxID=28930 RepID=A0A2N9EVL2_FAGSY